MKRTSIIIFFFLIAAGLLLSLAQPARADRPAQVSYQTPTALPDGRVLYKVQAGDSCLRIQLLTAVKVDQLIALNKLDINCTIQPGQELVLLVVTPVPTATTNAQFTATPLLPTPTPKLGTGEICVVLFADVNGNAMRDTDENPILGGAVSVTDREGSVSKTGLTSSEATPLCFKDIPEGDYNLSMAVPDGYNPTTTTNYPLHLIAGNRSIIDFGAQISTKPAANPAPTTAVPSGRSPLLLIVGGILILGGIAMGIYFRVIKR
jgi:LysM repeat protein